MKKIGIITFHRALNYGAVLQAFALYHYLSNFSETTILDYRCTAIENVYYDTRKRTFSVLLKRMVCFLLSPISFFKKQKVRKEFEEFRKLYMSLSIPLDDNNINNIDSQFDFFICGSDQIWNTSITNNDLNYFLKFTSADKRISYAASFGGSLEVGKNYDNIASELKKFKYLLVREKTAIKNLESISLPVSNVSVVCDPVFLISKEEWKKCFSLKKKVEKEYLFLYIVAPCTHSIELAKKISKEKGYSIKCLNLDNTNSIIDDDIIDVSGSNPVEFLSLIMNSSCVITTSFHAMAFALIFNIPFLVELDTRKKNNNSRLEELCSVFNVNNCLIKDSKQDIQDINWKSINDTLTEYSSSSSEVLTNIMRAYDEE